MQDKDQYRAFICNTDLMSPHPKAHGNLSRSEIVSDRTQNTSDLG